MKLRAKLPFAWVCNAPHQLIHHHNIMLLNEK